MDQLGRVPRRGDTVETTRFQMTVRRMDGRRVREVDLIVAQPVSDIRSEDVI